MPNKQSETVSTQLSGRTNNFDLLRFLFASLVIFSHSWPLGEGGEENEPLMRLSGQSTFGGIAVASFFIISGFLIAASWDRRKGIADFLSKRALRIYPGFIVANLIGVFIVAPLSGVSALSDTHFSILQTIWDSVRLRGSSVPGVFSGNPLPALNGSLWSIPFEFWCYVLVIVLGVIPLFQSRRTVLMLFLFSLITAYIFPAFELQWIGGMFLGKIFGYPFFWARLLPLYLSGVVVWRYRERIKISVRLLLFATTVLVISVPIPHSWSIVLPTCGAYIILWMAYNRHICFHGFGKYGDYSYGIYLYAFPIQQLCVMHAGGKMNPFALFAISLPLSIVAGACSWHLVERPCMTVLKRRRDRFVERSQGPAPASAGIEGVH